MNYPNLDAALTAFGASQPRFINESENAVFEVRAGGEKAALRLHRPGYQNVATIRSELWWTQSLAREGVPVPLPIPATNGELTAQFADGQVASMVSWVNGAPLGWGEAEDLAGSHSQQADVFYRIGQTLAKMHTVTDTLTLPDWFTRHAWDVEGFVGETPFWGPFWENPSLSADEKSLLLRTRAVVHDRLQVFLENGADFGLIHADAIRGNVFVDKGNVTLIDFDDAGFGFRLYDLGVLLTKNDGLENEAELQAAAVAGYRDQRALSAEAEALLPMFILLRRMASTGWIVPRAEPDSEWVRTYAERAVRTARVFLN